MYTCKSCLRRALRSLVVLDLQAARSDILLTSARKTTSPPTSAASTRNHATIASIQKGHHLKLLRAAFLSKEEIPKSKREALGAQSVVTRRNDRAREANKHHLDIQKDDDASTSLSKYTSDRSLQTELKWTGGDALKLARSVLNKLKADDPQKALEMVRLSEKIPDVEGKQGVDSVVSWNHVMDYHMSKASTREAFKVFNEMKKRGHKPDAHTYTIMLRGFTMNHRKPHAVEEAMKVYDSMWRPESNIKPSIIHSNAIINCLGRALNMDGLWSVAGRLPDRGPGAADKWTYTTILNTMQACAVRDARQLAETDGDQEAAAKVIQNAIGEGRRLWEDIVSRWRSGDVNIDQTLVCAMGRLLLLGQKHDWDDIFSLIEQTMRLPRVKPPHIRQGSENGEELENALALPPPKAPNGSCGLDPLEMAVAEEAAPKAKNEFAVVDLSHRPMRGNSASDVPSPYANIGNNVLSLLIEAAIKLREIPTGKTYWEKLTSPENVPFVMPDDDNLHSYLRLLRIARSSKAICDLLRQPVNGGLEGIWYRRGTFVLAMSTCARDFKNPNVFAYASSILDLMEAKLDKPDLKVMTMYLSLAMVTTPGVSTEISGDYNARTGENNTIRAIQRFNYSDLDYRKITKEWSAGVEKDENRDEVYVRGHNKHKNKTPPPAPEDLLEFMQTLNSAYDKVLKYRLKMTEKLATSLTYSKAELSRALQRISPDALPPWRKMFDGDEPADALTDQDSALKAKRYPDKVPRNSGGKIKAPRVVDVDKRHPFLEDREVNNREERRLRQDRDSSSLWRSDRDDIWAARGRDSSSSWKTGREDRRPTRGRDSSSSWKNNRDDRRSRYSSEPSSSEVWGKAWKNSVDEMGKEGRSKDWVVV